MTFIDSRQGTRSPVDPRQMANAIRFLSMDAIEKINDGHPGTPLGCAEITTALFTRHLKFNPKDPHWPDRDRFVQSNGHGSMLIYSLLYLSGYEKISLEQVKNFRQLGYHCPGHPEYDLDAGIETTTGPLGQGVANAVGMAVAEEFMRHRFGPDVVDHYTYALFGDGCMMEGVTQEVISLAGHLQLGKLIFIWDDNRITDDGDTAQATSDDNLARFRLSGWHVVEADGQDVDSVDAAFALAKQDPRPSLVACRTEIGFGVPRIQAQRDAHGGKVFKEDTDAAREFLGWPHEPFIVPDDILAAWRSAGLRNVDAYDGWQQRHDAQPAADKAEFDRLMAGDLPNGWNDALHAFKKKLADEKPSQPTIKTSGEVVGILADVIPELVGGAPDLEAATKHKNHMIPFTKDNRGGTYIHFGVREHAMGSMMNGMVLHRGVVPYGATFLTFSDYERHSLRMAAMMGLPVAFVFSHDSIGIGRNGPTHQPVEHIASLRAIPNMLTLRPADAVETAECWELALSQKTRPSSLIHSRQALPTLRDDGGPENRSAKGAYILADAEGDERQVTLMATGSEVQVALEARETLQAEGIPTAVISMPCWELFEEQDAAYRAEVIGRGTVRVAVEAAVGLGWERYIGEDGAFVGMSGFGASGSESDLAEHFGLTSAHVAEEARKRL